MEFIQENAPHIRRKGDLKTMMIDVLIALLPVVIFAIVRFTWHAVVNILLSVSVMALAEFVFVLIKNWGPKDGEKHPFLQKFKFACGGYSINNLLTPAISGIIFALLMPARETSPKGFIYFVIVIGALFGIVFGKLVFGGTGQNIFNPAAVGFIFVNLCFSSSFTGSWFIDAVNAAEAGGSSVGGTSLSGSSSYETVFSSLLSYKSMFLGDMRGAMGETCKLAILIGLVYLLVRREIDWRVVVSFLGTFLFLIAIAGLVPLVKKLSGFNYGDYILRQLLSGGLLFGATYMLTDPVTMPINRPSRLLYGMVAAVAVVFIRMLGGYHEGMAFSILLANMLAPVLDHYKWSTNRYNWKNILPLVLVPVCFALILVWALADRVGVTSAIVLSFGGLSL